MNDDGFQLLAKAFVGILDGHTQMAKEHEAMAGQYREVLGIFDNMAANSVPLRKKVAELERRLESVEQKVS